MEIKLLDYFESKLEGEGLPATKLKDLLTSDKIVILHFLRHLGCVYCKNTVDQLKIMVEQNPGFPPIYFVHQSSVQDGKDFFNKRFPDARHISDPKLKLFTLFGINRLKGLHLFDPRMILKGFKLVLKGYGNQFGKGDVFLLSGTFVFLNGNLVWSHRPKRAGDDPDFRKLAKIN